jgi:D-glycero-D-manno-heptose 1,7-bisphosphate phosphatase
VRPAAFLDRDGVLNVDRGYVHRAEDWEWMPGSREAIRALNDAGFFVVVVTNQSGIARGFYGEPELAALHAFVAEDLARDGGKIDAFYHCPHGPDDGCDCRKPLPGMLLRAIVDHDLDPRRSLLVGDRESDLQAAAAAGVRGFLYEGGDLRAFIERVLAEVS